MTHLSEIWKSTRHFSRSARIVLCACAVLLAPLHAASADPVAVLNEGFISIDTEGGLYLNFGNAHLSVQSTSATLPWQPIGLTIDCMNAPCAPGSTMSFSTGTNGTVSLGQANAYAADTNYGVVDVSGSLNFSSNGFRLPSDVASDPYPHPIVPFSFTGSIAGSRDGVTLFSYQLLGTGRADIYLLGTSSGYRTDEATAMTYKFTDAETPEPASMLLLGTGVVGLAARRRKRATGRESSR